MARSVRIIPATMLAAFLLLGLKVGEVARDGRNILASSFVGEAHAQQSPPAEKPAENKEAPKEAAPKTGTKDEGAKKEGEAKSETKGEAKAEPAKGEAKTETKPATTDEEEGEENAEKREFSQVEIDILQSLAKRRQELDDWSKQVQLKENMLIAVEGRIDEKTNNLQKMKKEVEILLAKYNEQEDIKIRSLVKIYETMKPKDAARIFEELDMPVLLTVVDKMKESKVAGVLTYMTPQKAKELTIQLTEQRKLQKNRSASVSSATKDATPAASPAVQ